MEDLWKRARSFAEEAAKKSQTITNSSKIADLVAETAKKSKELALEASKKADQLKAAAVKQADQIQIQNSFKAISDIIPPQLSSSLSSMASGSASSDPEPVSESELRRFGLTDDLRDFVRGLTSSTFQNFPFPDEAEPSDAETTASNSNVRKDLNEWQERHAMLVLSSVKEIKKLRYELCPRVMKEQKFWRIYFTLVSTHVAPYEKEYMEEAKRKTEERENKVKETSPQVKLEEAEKNQKSKSSTAKSTDQDLDTFLLGDLEDSDGGPEVQAKEKNSGTKNDGDVGGSFDDDFDKIENSDVEDDKDALNS